MSTDGPTGRNIENRPVFKLFSIGTELSWKTKWRGGGLSCLNYGSSEELLYLKSRIPKIRGSKVVDEFWVTEEVFSAEIEVTRPGEGATVRLADGTIQSVTTMRAIEQDETLQGSAITIDLEGKFVCPGLIDAHVYIAAVPGEKDLRDTLGLAEQISYLRQPYVCLQMIRRGFTTVRDCGGATLALKEAIAEGCHCRTSTFHSR